jgi:hypothetical protein
MNTLPSALVTDYATGYEDGRHAAKDRMPAYANPFRRGTPAYQGWNDGHYDERSARSVQVDRHNASVWSG